MRQNAWEETGIIREMIVPYRHTDTVTVIEKEDFMIHDHSSPPTLHTRQASPPPPHTTVSSDKPRKRLRMAGELVRGGMLGAAGFLLGSCPTLVGAAPLGIALLSASSSYTWYILVGVLLSAVLTPVSLSGWAWVSVYLLCVILRLMVRFFVDPPTLPDGRPCRGRTYLRLCWVSFKRNVGLIPDTGENTAHDYYAGADDFRRSMDPHASPEDPSEDPSEDSAGSPTASAGFSPRLFREHPFLRMLTAAACGLTAGIFGVIAKGFHLYDLLTALVLLLLTPIATFLLISCFGESGMTLLFAADPLRRGQARTPHVHERFHVLPILSVCFLVGCVVYSGRQFSPSLGTPYMSVHLSTLLGLLFTLLASSRLGVIPGLAVGVVCGLAASPTLSPVFILCAGAYALLAPFSPKWSAVGGCTVGALWCMTAEGVTLLALHLPAILLAPPLFFLTERIGRSLPSFEGDSPRDADEAEADLRDVSKLFSSAMAIRSRSDTQRAKMQALSEAFETLSKRFYSLSNQLKRPRMLDLRRICDDSFGKQCARCRNRDVCWGAEYDRTLEVQARLAAQLHGGGRATVENLPDSLKDFCPYMEAMVTDINGRCARMTENLLRSEKTEVFAADYAAIASLLSDALEEDSREAESFTCNRDAADRIYDYLTEMGVAVQGVVVGGKQSSPRKRVIVRGQDFSAISGRLSEVRCRLEAICGTKLTAPTFEEITYREEGGVATVMTLCSEAKLTAAYSGSTVPADWDRSGPLPRPLTHKTADGTYDPPGVCGDHIALFKTDNAYFYALISDGMGAGEDASLTSDICAMFLEKMLMAGNKVDISLRMLDTYVRSKNMGTGDECSATVDLMELDLMNGQAVFAKSGAAPTYVVREGRVYKLRARSMPLGILSDTPKDLIRFRTHPGDVVVMVSDGVTAGNDECPWLMDLLASPMPVSMDSLRADIIKRALTAGSEDDLTAIAIRVEEK